MNNPEQSSRIIVDLGFELHDAVESLRCLYNETADYIRLNKLGDVHHNQSMKEAARVLANHQQPKLKSSELVSHMVARWLKQQPNKPHFSLTRHQLKTLLIEIRLSDRLHDEPPEEPLTWPRP